MTCLFFLFCEFQFSVRDHGPKARAANIHGHNVIISRAPPNRVTVCPAERPTDTSTSVGFRVVYNANKYFYITAFNDGNCKKHDGARTAVNPTQDMA